VRLKKNVESIIGIRVCMDHYSYLDDESVLAGPTGCVLIY